MRILIFELAAAPKPAWLAPRDFGLRLGVPQMQTRRRAQTHAGGLDPKPRGRTERQVQTTGVVDRETRSRERPRPLRVTTRAPEHSSDGGYEQQSSAQPDCARPDAPPEP